MLKSLEDVFRKGQVELTEPPPHPEEARVLITFPSYPARVDLSDRGLDEAQAAVLRDKLRPCAEDWGRAEMGIYDEL